jgi:hypothetical protein
MRRLISDEPAMISRIFSGIHPELITPCCNAPPAPDRCLLDLVWADLEGKEMRTCISK